MSLLFIYSSKDPYPYQLSLLHTRLSNNVSYTPFKIFLLIQVREYKPLPEYLHMYPVLNDKFIHNNKRSIWSYFDKCLATTTQFLLSHETLSYSPVTHLWEKPLSLLQMWIAYSSLIQVPYGLCLNRSVSLVDVLSFLEPHQDFDSPCFFQSSLCSLP